MLEVPHTMDPRLEELIASAWTNHVQQRGSGMFDEIIEKLEIALRDPANEAFKGQIETALAYVRLQKTTAPICVETRNEIRTLLEEAGALHLNQLDIAGYALGPKGPMEL